MSSQSASPRQRATKQQAENLLYLWTGICLGVMATSFVWIASSLPETTTTSPFMSLSSTSEGWSLIHVFTGNASHLVNTSTIPIEYYQQHSWFSQLQQDQMVHQLLRNKSGGYFVDLAANDAIRISNTFALEQHGWSGLCIEANPVYWASLAYRQCQVVAAVIGNATMAEIMFKYPNRAGPTGGIVGFDNADTSNFGEDHVRYTVPLADVLQRFQSPTVMDYLSLDVEGAEEYILQAFPFHKYRFRVMTIERPSDSLQALLRRHGYIMLKKLKRYETLWTHESTMPSLDLSATELDTQHYKYSEKG